MAHDIRSILRKCAELHQMNPPASREVIARWESAHQRELPEDMKQFYTRFNGGRLFPDPDPTFMDQAYLLVPVSNLEPLSTLILPTVEASPGLRSLMRFCDLHDSDHAAIDLGTPAKSGPVYEAFPRDDCLTEIAASFLEFLDRALHSPDGYYYWLGQ